MAIESAKNLASIQNTVLRPTAEDVPSKIVIIGTYEAGKTITDEVPVLSLSPQETGSIYGFGSMLHRLHIQVNRGSDGQVAAYINPQAETGGAVAGAGEIDFTGSTGVLAGTLYLYIGFDLVRVSITAAMTVENIADAVVAAVNADSSLNYTAAKTAVTFEVTFTSKTLGVFGNFGLLSFNREAGQETPTGVTAAFTQPTGGTGLPDIQDALDGMGTGDNKNELGFTAISHGYGQDSTTLDAISTWVGPGDQLTGLYAKIVARPLYAATGDNGAGSGGLSSLTALGALRTTDRANVIFPVPGSKSHPSEIGAQLVGIVERIADTAAARSYGGQSLSRIDPGDDADRWTNTETSRDLAINAGISVSVVDGGVVKINDTITLYHPASIPETSNIYRELVNIRKIRNILENYKTTFGALTLAKSIIVEDITNVSSAVDRQYAIDIDLVRATQFSLLDAFVGKAWLYESDFAKQNIEIALRSATDGFDSIIKVILSGVNKITDNQVQADISTAVLS
jgi:phage tail sheath gpL-like